MKSVLRKTLLFIGTFVATTLFTNSALIVPVGLRLQDALQKARPMGQALYCKVVSVTRDDYEKRFGATSPLNAQELKAVIARLLEFKPAVLVIDINTSSAQFAKVSLDIRPGPTRIVWSRTLVGGRPAGCAGSGVPDAIWGHPEQDPPDVGVSYFCHDQDGKYRVFERTVPRGSRFLETFHWAVVKAYCESVRDGVRWREGSPAVCGSGLIEDGADIPPAKPRFREYAEFPHRLDDVLGTATPGSGNMLEGQVVILGGEYNDGDGHETPLGWQFGDQIIGQLVEAELRGDIIRDLPRWASIAIELAIGLTIFAAYELFRKRPMNAMLLSALLLGVVGACTIAAYYLGAFWFDAGVFFTAVVVGQNVEAYKNAKELAREEPEKKSA